MIDKILDYSGIIFAAIGIVCLFLEAFATFKRKSSPKLVIAGMVCLAVSVVGFIVTEVVLRELDIPSFVTVIWIALLWAYLVCNLVSAVLISRHNRLEKRQQKSDEENSEQTVNDLEK